MTGRHPIHETIGNLVSSLNGVKVILSQDCGGKQNIPFFYGSTKSRATELCNVDIAILKDNEVRMIIEIEESDIKPVNLFGKFLASESAEYYIDKAGKQYPISKPVIFIQIYDKSKLKEKSSKAKQFENIEQLVMRFISYNVSSKIKEYYIFDHTCETKIMDRIDSFIASML